MKQKNSLTYNKANFQKLEQERNMLKLTLQYINAENDKLKNELEDMKITARQNKELLKEYINQITNKDKVFEKMNAQIEQLTNRLRILENYKKLKITSDTLKNTYKQKKEEYGVTFKTSMNYPSTLATTTTNPQLKEDNKSNSQSTSPKLKPKTDSNLLIKSKSGVMITSKTKANNVNNIPKKEVQEFLSRQAALVEELSSMKDDIQFILENRNKSKMKEKLNQSIISNENSNQSSAQQSQNNSIIHSSNNVSYNYGNNTTIMNESSLNNSIISGISTQAVKRKFNIKDRFTLDDNLTEFLSNYNQYKNILFLIDNKGNVWELIKRIDLTMNAIISNPANLKSIVFCEKIQDNLSNIEIRDPFDNKSIITSEEDGKYSEFSLSKYIKESDG